MSRKVLVPLVLPADPTAALEAVTKQYVDKLARGRLPGGYAERTTNAGPQGPEAAFGVSITVTVAANRYIRLDACCRGINIPSGGTAVLRIKEGAALPGTELYSVQYPSNAGGGGPGGGFGRSLTPSAGSHTYFLSLEGVGATATLQAGATYPTYLEAIDLGGT